MRPCAEGELQDALDLQVKLAPHASGAPRRSGAALPVSGTIDGGAGDTAWAPTAMWAHAIKTSAAIKISIYSIVCSFGSGTLFVRSIILIAIFKHTALLQSFVDLRLVALPLPACRELRGRQAN